jgi:hypothetical protein
MTGSPVDDYTASRFRDTDSFRRSVGEPDPPEDWSYVPAQGFTASLGGPENGMTGIAAVLCARDCATLATSAERLNRGAGMPIV